MRKNDTFLNAQMGDYRLQEILAVGGMSRVYLGLDTKLERRAAVKVLELDQTWVDETIVQRFEREAKSVAALEHDNIITIYQYGQYEGAYFLAMQYIQGKDLRQVLKDYSKQNQRMPLEQAFKIMRQVASALDFAHRAGIVHRDIKPSNVLLTNDNKAILTDFGLVLRDNDATLGTAFGTPRYIAPEQAVASQQAVPQSDIYAFAVIMYEILTGDTPFTGETPMEIALSHVSDTPEPPSEREPSIPGQVDAVILKALSKEPTERYQTATAFVEAVIEGYGAQAPAPAAVENASVAQSPNKKGKAKATRESAAVKPKQVAVPSPVDGTPILKDAPPKRRSRVRALFLLILIVAIGGVGAFYYFNGLPDELPISLPGGVDIGLGGGAPAEIMLIYNADSLVIHNNTEEAFVTFQQQATGNVFVEFVRGAPGADRDDFRGDRLPGDQIIAGGCFRIGLRDEGITPTQCARINNEEFLNNPDLFFWRNANNELTFEVQWAGEVIQRCDTVREGEENTCQFAKPGDE